MKNKSKRFLKFMTIAVVGMLMLVGCQSENNTKMEYGWTTCLTYETGDRKLSYDYFNNLLEEMKENGMTRLVVMMASHGVYDPVNHGLAWPAKNEKLKYQIDEDAVNANEETEFFSKVIERAKELNIKILIEIKYLGMYGLEKGYPGIEYNRTKEGNLIVPVDEDASDFEREAVETLHICCDSPQAQEYMRDKLTDVLTRYRNLDGIVLEHPSYAEETCYCKYSRERIHKETGKNIEELTQEELIKWKAQRIKNTLAELKDVIKSVNPDFEVGFYTGFSPADKDIARFQLNRGHDTKAIEEVGFDYIIPYCEGRHTDLEDVEIERVIDYLAPMDFHLHTTIRRQSPNNYKLPPKGPEYIKKMIDWGKEYHKKNDRFLGMIFFNEVKLPQENRDAVYDNIKD